MDEGRKPRTKKKYKLVQILLSNCFVDSTELDHVKASKPFNTPNFSQQ
jgi:hypothetical protein